MGQGKFYGRGSPHSYRGRPQGRARGTVSDGEADHIDSEELTDLQRLAADVQDYGPPRPNMRKKTVRTTPVLITRTPLTGLSTPDGGSRLNITTDLLEWGGEIIHPCLTLPEALTATPQEFRMENNS